jgi:hypothetical protein
MIIGLRGLRGSGRSTVAAYLMKQHEFERRAFADPLKKSIAATLNMPYHEIDRYKGDPDAWVSVMKRMESDGPEIQYAIPFEKFIGQYAEKLKEVLGKDIWVDQVLPADGFYAGKKIVIPDIHFDNEVKRIHELGGFVVKVMLPGVILKDEHTPDVDYLLYHTRDTRDLYEQTERMLVSLGSEVLG